MSLAPPRARPSRSVDVAVPSLGGAVSYLAGCNIATILAAIGLALFTIRIVRSDYRSRLIYHADLAGFAAIGFAWTLCSSHDPGMDLLRALIHSCVYAAGLWTIARLYQSLRGRSGMGPADVKLAAALGPLVAPEAFGLTLVVAALLGLGLVGGRWLSRGRRPGPYTYVPFGAALSVAGYLVWLARQVVGVEL